MQASNLHGAKDWDWEENAPVRGWASLVYAVQKFKVNSNLNSNQNNLFVQTMFLSPQISSQELISIDMWVGSQCSILYHPFARLLRPAAATFFGLYLLRQMRIFSQEKHKISLHQSSPSWNFYLQLPLCLISNSIATVQHLCLWAWKGSVKSAHLMGQLRICIMEQPKLSLPKAPQRDCLTFRQILDIKPRVHDTSTYA